MAGFLTKRRFLRGMLDGAAVSIALPLLDCMLDGNGQALASGSPIPIRFGTWFWGLGMNEKIFVPKKKGADFDLPEEIAAIRDVRRYVNLYTNFNVPLDGRPLNSHFTGWVAVRTGIIPGGHTDMADVYGDAPGRSFDVTIADAIGGSTRFRSLELASDGDPKSSYSWRNGNAFNPPELSPIAFYQRMFGPEFAAANSRAAQDPMLTIRKSVLSGVREDSSDLKNSLGAHDRERLDQFFTSIREVEKRLEIESNEPAPAQACRVSSAPAAEHFPIGTNNIEQIRERHRTMADILALALACDQTRVFNMTYVSSTDSTFKRGVSDRHHHAYAHEEHDDPQLGYQVIHSSFLRGSMAAWAYFVQAMANVREGDGTLLDHSLIFAHSDTNIARIHSVDGMPMWTAGSAGGRMKTGLHIDGNKAPVTQVPLTCMRALGLQVAELGTDSLKATETVSEVLV
jgi:hypothetical protein